MGNCSKKLLGNKRKNGMYVRQYEHTKNQTDLHGLTLIELIISLAIVSLSIGLGMPAFIRWTQETSVRSQAEQIQAVILSARSYAVARNEWVRLQFTDKTGLPTWQIGCVTVSINCLGIIDKKSYSESNPVRLAAGLANTAIDINNPLEIGAGLPAFISFNSQGMATNQIKDKEINRLDVLHKDKPEDFRLTIKIESSGDIKICNPRVTKISAEYCG